MTDRLLTAGRWTIAALFLSLPLGLLTARPGHHSTELAFALVVVLSPWALASIGVALRVPAARGLGVGIGLASLAVWALAGFPWPEHGVQWLLMLQIGGLALALPGFGRVFRDGLRLRWTAAVLAFAMPLAAIFAVIHDGVPEALGWGAVALIGLGVIGLAFQRTWSLLVLLTAAAVLALTPFLMPPPPLEVVSFSLTPEPALAYLAAGALALTWLPWLGPVFRKLRG